ncbi:MAG: sugar ABC transporter permease [Tissierellia bacterium]|nr:sugar ABC transporter permease [Tissierellia bacterium]
MKNKLKFKDFLLYLCLPLLPLIVFWFIPLLVSFYISLTNWDYISPSYEMVGLTNYSYLLQDSSFHNALKNTLVFGAGTVIPTLILGFLMAMLLHKKMKHKAIYQAFLFSPWITPMVAMSIVWSWMYRGDGLINVLLGKFGISSIPWLTSSKYALTAVIIVTIWKNAGWAMIFYADALSKIPESLLEVGYLEGASWGQRVRKIILPMVSKTTFFLTIVTLINSIQAYDQISVLTQGGPAGASRTLLYLYYQLAFEQFNMGKATALSMLIVVLTAILALIMNVIRQRSWV